MLISEEVGKKLLELHPQSSRAELHRTVCSDTAVPDFSRNDTKLLT